VFETDERVAESLPEALRQCGKAVEVPVLSVPPRRRDESARARGFVPYRYSDATQNVLIEEKRLMRAARERMLARNFLRSLLVDRGRILPTLSARAICKNPNPSQSGECRVAELVAVIEAKNK